MAEGCVHEMNKHENVKTLLMTVRKHLSDPHIECRRNACHALTQFAVHLQPSMLDFHQVCPPSVSTNCETIFSIIL